MQSNFKKLTLLLIVLMITLVACGTPGETNNANSSNNNESNNMNNEVSNDMDADENSSANTSDDSSGNGENTASEREGFDLTTIPILDDATNLIYGDDEVVSYQTQHSTEEIVAFYKTEMANLGFTPGYEIVVADTIVARYEKGDLPIVVTTSGDGSGGFFVLVSIVDE